MRRDPIYAMYINREVHKIIDFHSRGAEGASFFGYNKYLHPS
jgi:hypothetical protein